MKRFNSASSIFSHEDQRGFSFLELLIIAVILIVMATLAISQLGSHKSLYATEDQALSIINVLREARHRALSQRQVMRVEVDTTDNMCRLIDENATGNVADDEVVREVNLESTTVVRLDKRPSNLGSHTPPSPSNFDNAFFAASDHPKSAGHVVWVARFLSDGSVVNTGGDITSSTIYIWQPEDSDSNASATSDTKTVRAITLFGGTAAVRLWGFNGSAFVAR
jgi:Tfp pilus assembly protein FimT